MNEHNVSVRMKNVIVNSHFTYIYSRIVKNTWQNKASDKMGEELKYKETALLVEKTFFLKFKCTSTQGFIWLIS